MIFWEEEEVCGCMNNLRGATVGPRGRGRVVDPRGQVLAPPAVFSVPNILKYFRKNHTKLAGHLKNFYFRGNSENRQKILFLLYFI